MDESKMALSVREWSNQDSHTVPEETHMDTTTLENCLAASTGVDSCTSTVQMFIPRNMHKRNVYT